MRTPRQQAEMELGLVAEGVGQSLANLACELERASARAEERLASMVSEGDDGRDDELETLIGNVQDMAEKLRKQATSLFED